MKGKMYTLAQLRGAWAAGKAAAGKASENQPTPAKVADPFLGKYVHAKRDGEIHMQGEIVAATIDKYLIRWFSWMSGEPNEENLVSIDAMAAWDFYSEHSDWVEAGNAYWRERWQR
jgi:hypothetical protein